MAKKSNSEQQDRLVKLFCAVFTLCLLDKQLTRQQLDDIVRAANRSARRNAAKLVAKRQSPVDHDAIALVIYHWQRSPNYLDESGNPIPIPARGPAPSIEALFKKLKVERKFRTGLVHLRQLRRVGVTRRGLYYPRSEATIIPTLTPEVVESLTQTINRLIATVLQNTSIRRKGALRLLERVAVVPDLPRSKLPEFKRFVREQAGGLIETVNDWLESRRGNLARRPNAPGRLTAGLHAFAFVDKKAH